MAAAKAFSEFVSSDAARAALSTIMLGGIMVLLAMDKPIPNELWLMAGTVVGFFFGGYARNQT